MKTGTRKRLRTALSVGIITGGLLLTLLGAMALYGTPGLALSNFLPISLASDRHPPTDRVLMDARKSFQDYQDNAGQLFSAGQTLIHKYELAYLRIESRGGVSIHRSYDSDRVSYANVQKIERNAAETAKEPGAPATTPTKSGRYYFQKFPIQILKGPELIEDVTITIAYEQIYMGGRRFANLFGVPHTISRLTYIRFDDAAPYIAGVSIALGLALVFLSLRNRKRIKRRPRSIVFTDETWPDPNRPLNVSRTEDQEDEEKADRVPAQTHSVNAELSAPGEESFRILSDPANFVFDSPLNAEEEQLLRQKLASLEEEDHHTERYEFEQERWNLPGFQSVMQPLRNKIRPDDLDLDSFATAGKARGVGKTREVGDSHGFDNHSSLFDFRYYRFHEQPGFPEQVADIESFAKGFLTAVTDLADHATATLFLRNRRGKYHATLRRSGSIFISGAALGVEPVGSHLVQQLEEGRYVVMDEGHEIYFPVPCRQTSVDGTAILGLIRLKSDRPLYNAETLAAAWYEIRKFGESLFQARVFEEAVSDPESTLHNGLTFHRDLMHEYSLKREIKNGRMLSLIRFRGRSNPESVQLFGLGLRSFFAAPFRLYRIASDVFAVLGPQLPVEDLERRLGDFLEFVREQEPVDANAGCALLMDDGAGPSAAYDWFRQAALALEQCEKTGLNRLRLYDSLGDAGTVVFRQFVNQE